MKYKFRDILNQEIYENSGFLFVASPNYVFINMIIDTVLSIANNNEFMEYNTNRIDEEFGISTDVNYSGNTVDIDTFRKVVYSPSINGKWVCICDYKTLSKKQKSYIEMYSRYPSELGIMLIYSTDYKDYKRYLKDLVLNTSKRANILDLNYVHDKTLKEIVRSMFAQKGKSIEVNALNYFIVKVGRTYDEIENMMDNVIEETAQQRISIVEVKRALKKVENFTIDDFMVAITQPISNDKTNNKKVYRMMVAMIELYGLDGLVRKMMYEINILIEFRMYINKGIIPVSIRYIYNDCIKEIGQKSRISKYSENTFRRKALIAAQTSIRDLVYIKMILNKAINSYNETVMYRAVYDIVTRTVLLPSRVDNIIGIKNIIDAERNKIDNIKYIDKQEDIRVGTEY